jgi:hypothetical protein
VKSVFAATTVVLLSACGHGADPAPVQRFSLDEARHVAGPPVASPDTADASWTVSKDGQSIVFGKGGAPVLLTLACRLKVAPAQLVVIRHVPARPGLKAMFPVIGNGTVARFPLNAALSGREWRWEGALPAADPLNDVFTGHNELEATLPGGGTLVIGASRIPGEFVNWCRANGKGPVAATPASDPVASPVASANADPKD